MKALSAFFKRRISRRTFIVSSLLLGAGGFFFFRRYLRELEQRGNLIVTSLCNHFVPGNEKLLSAQTLGVDRQIINRLQRNRLAHISLLALVREFDRLNFLNLSFKEQQELIRSQLEIAKHNDPTQTAEFIEDLYRDSTMLYYQNPETWAAIKYRTPQPQGYPDYTTCLSA